MNSGRDRATTTAEKWNEWFLVLIAMSYPDGLQIAALQRQKRNRARMLARAEEALKAKESGAKEGGV